MQLPQVGESQKCVSILRSHNLMEIHIYMLAGRLRRKRLQVPDVWAADHRRQIHLIARLDYLAARPILADATHEFALHLVLTTCCVLRTLFERNPCQVARQVHPDFGLFAV
jgi:hypothetical protein